MTSMVFRGARILALAATVVALTACSLLPAAGPTRNQLFAGSIQREGDAFIVEVNARVTRATAVIRFLGFQTVYRTLH